MSWLEPSKAALPTEPGSDVAVILVNWRGAGDTIACLASIAQLNGPRPYVIVVENGSGDHSLAELTSAPGIDVLIESRTNLGFGGGCNLGIAHARQAGFKYVWLLNNDTNPMPGALIALRSAIGAESGIGRSRFLDPSATLHARI